MAVHKRPDTGKWEVRIRHKKYPTFSQSYQTKAIAEKEERRVLYEMESGSWRDTRAATGVTLKDLLTDYRDDVMPARKGRETESVRINAFLVSWLANISMAALRPEDIEEYIQERRTAGIMSSTISREISLLRSVIKSGIKSRRLNITNPVSAAEKPKKGTPRDRRVQGEELQRLLDACTVIAREDGKQTISGMRNPFIRPLIEFALETGMRRSEILGMQWQYIDLEAGIVHIPDTKGGKGGEEPVPRDVVLTKRARAIIDTLPKPEDLAAGGPVFPVTIDSLEMAWGRALPRARKAYIADCLAKKEVPLARMLTDLHFHDLRHEATTRMAAILDMKELMIYGGWKDITTLARYYNPTVSDIRKKLKAAGL